MTQRTDRCETCNWYQAFADEWKDGGQCRFSPPTAPYGFPSVEKTDWCGEWDLDQTLGDILIEANEKFTVKHGCEDYREATS